MTGLPLVSEPSRSRAMRAARSPSARCAFQVITARSSRRGGSVAADCAGAATNNGGPTARHQRSTVARSSGGAASHVIAVSPARSARAEHEIAGVEVLAACSLPAPTEIASIAIANAVATWRDGS